MGVWWWASRTGRLAARGVWLVGRFWAELMLDSGSAAAGAVPRRGGLPGFRDAPRAAPLISFFSPLRTSIIVVRPLTPGEAAGTHMRTTTDTHIRR